MISAEDVISTLSNSKFKKIQLPVSAKFSQFDCYEAKRREMECLAAGITSLKEMTDIGEALNSDSILEELGRQYGEHTLKVADPGAVLGSEKLATATIDYDTYLNYQENELVGAAPALMELVNGIAPTQRVFLYGLKNPESFYKAVLVASRPDFITKTKQNRVNDIFTFKREIGISVRDPARAKEYQRFIDPTFNPDTISANLVDKETYVDDALAQATCDFIGRSLIVFDMVGKTFKTYRTGFWLSGDSAVLGESYVLVLYQGCYLPLIHVDTRNLLNGDSLVSRMVSQFEHTNRDQYKFRDAGIQCAPSNTSCKVRSALNDPYFDPAKMVSKSDLSFDDIQTKVAEASKRAADEKSSAKKPTKGKSGGAITTTAGVENVIATEPVISTEPGIAREHGADTNTVPTASAVSSIPSDNLKTAKLAELQEIATGLGIDITMAGASGKPKKKTKEQLIGDITAARLSTQTTN
jgi:hypothetical protein